MNAGSSSYQHSPGPSRGTQKPKRKVPVKADLNVISDNIGEELDLGLFVFNLQNRVVEPVAGTYHDWSSYWNFKLSYGLGSRGLALRRGRVEFHNERSPFHVQPPKCPNEKFVLVVPIVIPPDCPRPEPSIPLGFFKAAICLSSPSESSVLRKLDQDNDPDYGEHIEQIANRIYRFSWEMWKKSRVAERINWTLLDS